MGVRLSVHWNIGRGYVDRYGSVDLSSYFECPHKYYGYEDLSTSESYKYLHDILKVSEKEDPDMLQGLYDYWAVDAGPYTLSESEFKLFVELYCKDLSEQFPGEKVGGVEKLKDIATEPGDKQIDWG